MYLVFHLYFSVLAIRAPAPAAATIGNCF
ncbi:uncharacterized protein Dmoj_GI26657 [Drosophila mojavensis]|uniref:Uncharacterized protein n=1 Tax=Drosophila mojavensis TaxID=7230 RepID=A0A0Q9XNF8_DROMO|nr:uncharacterized protein Dmoj_GI26657 [Drosophila mojavensis]